MVNFGQQAAEIVSLVWGTPANFNNFNRFVSDCRYVPYLRRYSPTNLCDGAQMVISGDFFASCICSEPPASSTFQTCILNSHWGHAVCRSMVDIQSVAAEIGRGKKIER